MTSYKKIPSCLLEYACASLVLHAGCLALLLLRLTYYNAEHTPPKTHITPPKKSAQKEEPRIILKRVPATPTPVINQEQEAARPTPPRVAAPASSAPTPAPQAMNNAMTQPTPHQEIQRHEQPQQPPKTQAQPAPPKIQDQPKIQESAKKAVPLVKRNKMQHSWYKDAKKSPDEHTVTTEIHHSSLVHEAALAQMTSQAPYKKLSEAEKAAEKFRKEFQEAGVRDYISAIHHAIAFSLNRMRISLAAHDIPAHIIMQVTISADGCMTDAHVQIPNYHDASLVHKIKQAVIQAAPFRPFPPSITTPDLTLTIDAYPDSSCFKDRRYSTRATPLIFTLHNNNQRF